MKKLIIITILILAYPLSSFADSAYFIDYTKILNTSKLGAAAQKELKERFKAESKKFKDLEEKIKKEESEIISQKQALTAEEYKKKFKNLERKLLTYKKINKVLLIVLLNLEMNHEKNYKMLLIQSLKNTWKIIKFV